MYSCTFKRSSKARRLRISVNPHGVTVTMPPGIRRKHAEAFLAEKEQWIQKKISIFRANPGPSSEVTPEEGAVLWVFGRRLRLCVKPGIQQPCISGYELLLSKENLRIEILQEWMDAELKRKMAELSDGISTRSSLKPSRIRLGNAKSRWGSCSAKGVVMVNRKLVHAPPEVIKYVLAHEILHLRHRNHSREFWRDLAQLVPWVTEARRWLKIQGAYLI